MITLPPNRKQSYKSIATVPCQPLSAGKFDAEELM